MKIKHLLLLVTFALSVMTHSISQAADTEQLDITGKKGGKLILSLEGNPKTFNPHLMSDVTSRKTMTSYVYLGLTTYDYSTNTVVNELAKSMIASPDGKTYTYKIRQGLKWSDGTPFTVDDVVFSWNALIAPTTLSPIKDAITLQDGSLPQIKKIDDETVEFTMNMANVLFNDDLTNFYILPKHKWQKTFDEGQFNNALNAGTPVEDIVGMGPFILKKFIADQVMIFERNPHYYKFDKNGVQLPYLDKVMRLITPDFEATMIKVRNGEIDMYQLQAPDFDILKREEAQSNLKVYELGAAYDVLFYNFNFNPRSNSQGKPYVDPEKIKYFSDTRFRQALNYAIDRKSIVGIAYTGRATPIYGTESPTNAFWHDPAQKTYPYDTAKAKAMLDEIGLKDLNGDGLRDLPNGKTFEFTIKTNVENKVRVSVANLIKNDFEKVGIKANINPIPFNSLITSLKTDFDYECVVMGWGSSVPPDPLGAKNVYLSHSEMHYWNAKSPKPIFDWEQEMDTIINTMSQTQDRASRQKQWFRFTQLWNEHLPQTMLVSPNIDLVINKKFKNLKPSVLRPYFDWNVEEIYDETQP